MLKAGLMSDLLIGNKLVKVDEADLSKTAVLIFSQPFTFYSVIS